MRRKMGNLKRFGIMAYGSLLDDPGEEIKAVTVNRINKLTPFRVEFARSSVARGGAPTLIPVDKGGANVKAQILVLKEGVSEDDAINMLYRREIHRVGSGKTYARPTQPSEDTVLVERLENIDNLDAIFYTKIATNIKTMTPENLARLAIDSVLSKAGARGFDGISYLIIAKRNGIKTPLMPKYEKEILREAGATSLEDAFDTLQVERLKKEGKIPKETEILKSLPTLKDVGKFVAFTATIGETYVKLSPPIRLIDEYEGEKYPIPYNTILLDLKARVENSYLFVGFKKNTYMNDVLNYFNNVMALFNIISIPFDFVTASDILIRAKGIGTTVEFISSSKAHGRGYGIEPVEINAMDFTRIVATLYFLWGKIKNSEYFRDDNFFQLLGYAQYYLFHGNYLLSFIHAWIFLESCINVLWRELIYDSFSIGGSESKHKGTPVEEEREWTTMIKIDELFLKSKIDKKVREELQALRAKRNKVFHRDRQLQKRTIVVEDAAKAVGTGLRLFYKMIESGFEEDKVIGFTDIKGKMWETVNRGQLHRTRIIKKKTEL